MGVSLTAAAAATPVLSEYCLTVRQMVRPAFYKSVWMVGIAGPLKAHLNIFKNRVPAIFGRSLLWYEGTFRATLTKQLSMAQGSHLSAMSQDIFGMPLANVF
jgi:hypothetical protein